MINVTCDLCGKDLRPGGDDRWVVKIEVYAAHDPYVLREDDLDDDHMEAVSQLLRAQEELEDDDAEEPTHRTLRYDLCPECQKRFVKDPLNREADKTVEFSEN